MEEVKDVFSLRRLSWVLTFMIIAGLWTSLIWIATRYPQVSGEIFRFSAISVVGTAMSGLAWSMHTMILYNTGMNRLRMPMPLWEMHLTNILFNILLALLCSMLALVYPELVYCAVAVVYTVVGCVVEVGVRVKRRPRNIV